MFKLVLEKAEEPEIQVANICWIMEKARESQKNIYFCFIDYAKIFGSQSTVENSERWFCESAGLNMPENLENSAVATGLENVTFHSNPKERQAKQC